MMKNLTLTYLKTSLLFWHPFYFNKGKKEVVKRNGQKCPGHFAAWMTYLFSEAGSVTSHYLCTAKILFQSVGSSAHLHDNSNKQRHTGTCTGPAFLWVPEKLMGRKKCGTMYSYWSISWVSRQGGELIVPAVEALLLVANSSGNLIGFILCDISVKDEL